jgi:hypothetical protein
MGKNFLTARRQVAFKRLQFWFHFPKGLLCAAGLLAEQTAPLFDQY